MIRKSIHVYVASVLIVPLFLSGCSHSVTSINENTSDPSNEMVQLINPTSEIIELENEFFTVVYEGDNGFDDFLNQGGAESDAQVVEYLKDNLLDGMDLDFLSELFGCSTISVKSPSGEALFGRNFDWQNCEAMVVLLRPENDYASISTVNIDFIRQGAGGMGAMGLSIDQVRTLAALYAPLDGMNEAGLVISVNMIQDSSTINQNTEKSDLTTTTAIRLLLNKAGNVEEALDLLAQYDLHSSMGMMIHFALADVSGRAVVVEYINNEMKVIETPVVTNFYLAPGDKQGIGTAQSHERYDILMKRIADGSTMSAFDVKEALKSVGKANFGEFESTEWSIVYNQNSGEVSYYHRENYENRYVFTLKEAL